MPNTIGGDATSGDALYNRDPLEDLVASCGVDFSPLAENRAEVVETLRHTADFSAISAYRATAERIVDTASNEQLPRAQIALIIHMALVWRDADNEQSFREELNDARDYADNMGYNDMVSVIDEVR